MMTRRNLFQAATTVGIGMLASPLARAKSPESSMVARICFDSYGTLALRQAVHYAGDDGFVASLPQILHARVNADYDTRREGDYFYGYDSDYGIGGYAHMIGMARYVAVAPRDVSVSGLRGQDFEL